MFSKNMRSIYLYLVSFITLMMIIGGIIVLAYNITNLILPEKYDYYPYSEKEYMEDNNGDNIREREEYISMQEKNAKNRSIRSTISSVVFLGVVTPIFMYHWKRVQRENTK